MSVATGAGDELGTGVLGAVGDDVPTEGVAIGRDGDASVTGAGAAHELTVAVARTTASMTRIALFNGTRRRLVRRYDARHHGP